MRISNIAAHAINQQYDRLHNSAARVAKMDGLQKDGKPQVDLVREAAIRIEADAAIRANLSVIKNEDDLVKHLIDTIA
ncbi:MAG: hypothetical protein GY847_02710 [Proteobacteria bacterium]|nr:hypothetical protein [Pseudomonadota bacterium]